ncbi:unnamed protein product [Ranitomeya imitator]|uniref:Ricin B lectin domain-containing protein n=1 Tax=Ranitomeya imitator TaxID=111125 RepID=A0ABN9KX91_9NEOB|nr:unnamed protein product [Ranitomeya imitator]
MDASDLQHPFDRGLLLHQRKRHPPPLGMAYPHRDDEVEDFANISPVGVNIWRVDKNIIQIDYDRGGKHIPEDIVHKALENGWGITEPEGHHQIFIVPIPGVKGRLPFVPLTDANQVNIVTYIFKKKVYMNQCRGVRSQTPRTSGDYHPLEAVSKILRFSGTQSRQKEVKHGSLLIKAIGICTHCFFLWFWVGCYQKSRLLVAASSCGLLLLLSIFILGYFMTKYYAMETELEKVKEQHRRHLMMGSFLLYNEAHNKCAEVRSPSTRRETFELTASVCSSLSNSQLFHWLPGGRLMSSEEGLCVGVEGKPQSQKPLRLYQCDFNKTLSWDCYNDTLLGVKRENLFFNFGNNQKHVVMLYWGSGVWSRWRARDLDGTILDGGACA